MPFDVLANLQSLAAKNTPELTEKVKTSIFSGASGDSLFGSNNSIESGLSTRRIENQIENISDRNLVNSTQFQFDNVQIPLFNLAENQQTIGSTLSENSKAFTTSIQEAFNGILGNAEATNEINERLSKDVSELGQSITDLSKSQDGTGNPLEFLTKNPVLFGLGTGGLIVGSIALFLAIK